MKMFKKIRNLKVYERLVMRSGFRISYKSVPTIVLSGEWLRELGFKPGDQIQVQCNNGELSIAKTTEQIIPDPAKATAA